MATSPRKRRRRLAATAIGAVAVVQLAAAVSHAGASTAPAARRAPASVYVVKPGDTLWSIASRLLGAGADPRPVVDRLAAANGGSVLVAGQRIVLPSA